MANYTFSQPIRYYKANDPYYYEVDNIPLRQLEENILYVKDILEGVGSGASQKSKESNAQGLLTESSELNLYNIKQLRAKTDGQSRTVTVNAGVFTSRINDAFNISKPLSKLILGVETSPTTVIPVIQQVWSNIDRNVVGGAFAGPLVASNSYNINGLEFYYTFYNSPGGLGNKWAVVNPTSTNGGKDSENYPKYGGVQEKMVSYQWPGTSNYGPLAGQGGLGTNFQYIFENLPDIHMAFVKMWRGVFRTAVVDFPQSTIEVPAWSDDDFYYLNSDGTKVQLNATSRIDLLVAYSMPIDVPSTTIQSYENGFCTETTPSPHTIDKPMLGLVRGAGIGIQNDDSVSPPTINTLEGCGDEGTAGSPRIVANKSDHEDKANIGITNQSNSDIKIHGSFPSPEDLLNLAPLLALGVEKDNPLLVGQTVLPLAYVVVKKGVNEITQADIIDIRPFLRTAELTYNERAGVAAANPPLSFANPAVGAYQLQSVVDSLSPAAQESTKSTTNMLDGKALYTDYVMGGLAYGVEGTLLTMCDGPQEAQDPFGSNTQGTTYTDVSGNTYDFTTFNSSKAYLDTETTTLREAFLEYVYKARQSDLKRWLSDPNSSFSQNTLTYLGLPAGTIGRNIPLFPEWDMPMNGTNYQNLMTGIAGVQIPKVTWWMWFEAASSQRSLAYVPGGVVATRNSQAGSYLNERYTWGAGGEDANAFVNICSKRLEITFPDWVNDYDILIEYVNCSPITSYDSNQNSVGLGGGLSVNKGPVVSTQANLKKAIFQINSISDNFGATDGGDNSMIAAGQLKDKMAGPLEAPAEVANSPSQFLSYSVALAQFRSSKWGTGTQNTAPTNTQRFVPKFGASYYPTVKFTIIGYTSNPITRNTAYGAANNYTLLQNVTQGAADNILNPIGPLMADPGTGTNTNSRIDISTS